MANLRISLANIPWSRPTSSLIVPQAQSTADPILIIKYSPEISAIFFFDDSIENFDFLEIGGLVQYIEESLIGGTTGRNVEGQEQPEGEPALTMQLVCLEVDLNQIQHHLDLLGIDTTTSQDGDQS